MALKISDHVPAVLNKYFPTANTSILIHVWSVSCPACKANMPHLQELRDKYSGRGLQTVAIHMPRGEAELDEAKVRVVADGIGITEMLIFDNEHKIVDTFGVNAVPAYFLFDTDGKLRRHALGNFGVRMIGQAVQRLFGDVSDETKE